MTEVTLRELTSLAELKATEDFQRAVWGQDDPADNADLMLAIQHEGGLVAGAFADGRMLGFLFAFPGATPGLQHSHRLGVLPQARGLGLAPRLKWFQREWCLARGVNRVRWTFDPLRTVNASLNIHVLGGTSVTYLENYYGNMQGINLGLPSDRLLIDWHLDSPEVVARAEGLARHWEAAPVTGRVRIPADIDQLLATDPDAALAARLELREVLTAAFARGERIHGFDKGEASYLLSYPAEG